MQIRAVIHSTFNSHGIRATLTGCEGDRNTVIAPAMGGEVIVATKCKEIVATIQTELKWHEASEMPGNEEGITYFIAAEATIAKILDELRRISVDAPPHRPEPQTPPNFLAISD